MSNTYAIGDPLRFRHPGIPDDKEAWMFGTVVEDTGGETVGVAYLEPRIGSRWESGLYIRGTVGADPRRFYINVPRELCVPCYPSNQWHEDHGALVAGFERAACVTALEELPIDEWAGPGAFRSPAEVRDACIAILRRRNITHD
ncbi:MAG: hypothetical protein KGL39_47095 [Patescibacteria group bacterium]|nr:hypothetical protein [Patescibacteria group bacterium]